MENLFIDILELTLPISALIAMLLLFSPFLKRAYVAKWRYFMWLFVAVRMIVPLRFAVKAPVTVEIPHNIAVISEQTVTKSGISALQLLTAVWLVGMGVYVAYQVICYISFKRLVRRWQRNVNDKAVLKELEAAKEFAGMKRDIGVKYCKAVTTPMIFGIIRPVLLLPDMELSSGELSVILRHELVHLKRRDIWYKLIIMAARAIYWFDPITYFMVKAANRDLELACDAEVVKNENSEFRQHYCEAIMRLVHNGTGAKTALSTCFFFSKKTVMERFKYILDEKIKRSGVIMFCVVAFSAAVSGGIVSFAAERVAVKIEDDLHIVERQTGQPKSTAEPDTETVITEQPAELYTVAPSVNNKANAAPKQNIPNTTASEAAPIQKYEVVGEGSESAMIYDKGELDEVSVGAERTEVYDRIGEPDSVSGNGSKETYSMSDGSTVILQYDGEVLDSGYIVVNN